MMIQWTEEDDKKIPERNKIFLHTCKLGDITLVKQAVTLKYDVNAVVKYWTGLMAACDNRDIELIDYLLSLPQLNVNTQNYIGQSALHRLMGEKLKDSELYKTFKYGNRVFNQTQIKRLIGDKLIKKGADINLRGFEDAPFGLTPLASAVLSNSFDMVRFLVIKGANLSLLYGNKKTKVNILQLASNKPEIHSYLQRERYLQDQKNELKMLQFISNSPRNGYKTLVDNDSHDSEDLTCNSCSII